MTATGPAGDRVGDPAAGGVSEPVRQPPWLLLYVVLAAWVVVPGEWSALWQDWHEIEAARPDVAGVEVYRFFLVAQAVPSVSLATGLVYVLFPALRRRLVERACRLVPPADGVRAEVQHVVDRHATGVDVRLAAVVGSGAARIYPLGLRRARIAVFPSFLHLWDTDRAAAEATLLHEIAHRRQGEHLLAGLGSPFGWLVRLWVITFTVFTVLPVALLALQDTWQHGLLASAALPQLAQDGARPVKLLLFAVAGLWLAELAADDWAARTRGSDAVLAALSLPVAGGRLTRLFRLLDHPPAALRRRVVRRRGAWWLLACWPAGVTAAHFVVSAAALVPTYWLQWHTWQGLPARIVAGAVLTLSSSLPLTVASLLLLLAWPWLSGRWPRLWTARGWTARTGGPAAVAAVRPERRPVRRLPFRPFALAAALPVLMVAGAGLPTPVAGPPPEPGRSFVDTRLPDALRPERMPLVLRVTRVVTVEAAGPPEAAAAARELLGSLRWTFDADGGLEVDGAGLPRDRYPVRARWVAAPHLLTFQSDDVDAPVGPGAPVSMVGSVSTDQYPATMELLLTIAASPQDAGSDRAAPLGTPEIYRVKAEVGT